MRIRSGLLAVVFSCSYQAGAIIGHEEQFRQRWNGITKSEELRGKKREIESARVRLKQNFVGIDAQIDYLLNLMTTWHLLPNAQVRPLIINLWGMTGVGKTSLVRAAVKELKLESLYAEVDLGELVSEQRIYSGENTPHPLYRYAFMSGKAMIWMLDEFHTARTLNEQGFSIDRVGMRPVFKLLSDGIVPTPTHKELLLRTAQQMIDTPSNNVYLPESAIDELHVYVYPEKTREDVRADLNKKGRRSMGTYMLSHIPQHMPLERNVDYRRTLVIVAGNLDEAFRDVSAMDPLLMSADEFHASSKLVTVRRVKEALSRRFTVEQIARLGNTHIIYPAFSEQGFRGLIELELSRLATVAMEEVGLKIEFTPAVTDLLYSEGVIPSQGARPPLTTVTAIIGSRMTDWLIHALTVEQLVDAIKVDVKDGATLLVTGLDEKSKVFELKSPVDLQAGDRLKVEPSPTQARVAYREAAKAVVGMFASGRLPIAIYSKSSDSTPGGSVRFPSVPLPTRADLVNTLRVLMAAREVEKAKYEGDDGTSVANAGDIYSATELSGRMIQDWGMGPDHVTQSSRLPCSTKFATYEAHLRGDGRAQNKLLCEAATSAAEILRRESALFEALAEHLKTNATIHRVDLIALVKKHGVEQKTVELLAADVPCAEKL